MKNFHHEGPAEFKSASRRQPNSRERRTPEEARRLMERDVTELGLQRASLIDIMNSLNNEKA